MKKITRFAAGIAMMLFAATTSFAQTDLGADCGCPPVASRPAVNLSTLANPTTGQLTGPVTTLTCDKKWVIDMKIYVDTLKTLVIEPGTLVVGATSPSATDATALIIQRGAKIYADGSRTCPIVFTTILDATLNGSYAVTNKGKWGGIVIAGKGDNNLNASGSSNMYVSSKVGKFEGFASAVTRNYWGGGATPNDDDNSGVLRYVSIRHAGANLTTGSTPTGNEINALSLYGVGRGTTIENIEIISCDDDNVEIWGGAVNLKYISTMFGNDDMLDWDDGWVGKCQFFFGAKAPALDTLGSTAYGADNGIEADGDDSRSNQCRRSHPVIYNMTLIGNDYKSTRLDNTGVAGICAKELTEGEIYNSIFANFKAGLLIQQNPSLAGASARAASVICGTSIVTAEAYSNWNQAEADATLKIKNCTFPGYTGGLEFALDCKVWTPASGADLTKFTADNNVAVASVPGFDFNWDMTGNNVNDKFDAIPNPALGNTYAVPADGFFTPANYRGAFAPGLNWLSDFSNAKLLNPVAGMAACPSDIDKSGVINVDDFNQLLIDFGSSCQ